LKYMAVICDDGGILQLLNISWKRIIPINVYDHNSVH
jgi:hypothetical protein